MSNALIAIDAIAALAEAIIRIQTMLQTAQIEGRDITDEELAALRAENAAKADKFING